MSAAVNLGMWAEPLWALAVGGLVLVLLAAVAARWTPTGAGRRAIWQAAFVSLALLGAAEVMGLSGNVREWLSPATAIAVNESDWIAPVPRGPKVVAQPSLPVAAVAAENPKDENASGKMELADSSDSATAWWPGVIWSAGAVLLAGRACLARMLLLVFRQRRGRLKDPELITLAAAVAERLGYRRKFGIVEAGSLISPAAFGIIRPTLALPAGFRTEFTPAQQEAMLAHELAHLAARDPSWHFFAQLTTAIFWWHPMSWWALAQIRTASERAADEASLVVADGPGVLASCLVQLGTRLAQRRPFGWLSMAGNGFRSGLGRRVERLLHLDGGKCRPLGKGRRLAILILGPMLLVAASALSSAWATPAENEGDVPMNSAWKRSVAATVLVVAIGSADSPGGQQPKQPKSGGGTVLPEEPQLRPDEIQTSAAKLAEAMLGVAAQREELKKKIDTKDEKELDTIKAQLRELEAKQKDLEAMRMKLEEQMKAASAARTKLEKQPARIKVFRLKHRDPNEVSSVLTDLLPHAEPGKAGDGGMMGMMQGAMGKGMMGGGEGGGMKGGGMGGFGGGAGMMGGPAPGMMGGMGAMGMGGGLMGIGGGFGGLGGGMAGVMPRPNTSWRIAVDERTNSLIVRGNESDLRTIGDIVAALDVGDSKSATKLKNLRTFKLKHADVNQVSQIVQDLELNVRVSILPSSEMLVISGGESALKEVADLIEELDVEGKPVKEIKKPQKQ
jgi:hypothetical protein